MGKKVIMIGHGHLDPVWLWRWEEGMQEVKATFRSALDRMKEYEEFVFSCSSAAFYEFVEENAPDMFAEIRQRVAEGRWNIVGGWWIEPDCNIPCGEAMARQALLGQRYFLDKFGRIAKTGFCPDSFGHAGTLPMLLQGGGMENYIFMRPAPGEKPLPEETFDWYAPDGSCVRAFRIPYEYLSWGHSLEAHMIRCRDRMKNPDGRIMCFYGVGNHGGGPTKENLECIRQMRKKHEGEFVTGTVEDYFETEDRQGRQAVVEEELQYHAPGCYSAGRMVKRYNRKAENSLIASEIISSLADLEGTHAYPDNFGAAWKQVAFQQFHDILAGTCTASAYEQVRDSYGYALTIGRENGNHAMQSIAWNIHIEKEEGMVPVVLFHPHAHRADVPVVMEFQGADTVDRLLDTKNREVPYAVIPEESFAGRRTRIVARVSLPSMGYCVLRAYRIPQPRVWQEPEEVQGSITMENAYWRIVFAEDKGGIQSLYDKEKDVWISREGLGIPRVVEDAGNDTWAHNVYRFDRVCGEFVRVRAAKTECNALRQCVRITSTFQTSVLTQDFYLYHDAREIRVSGTLWWQEKGKLLKLYFHPETVMNRAVYEVPGGRQERAVNGAEVCGQRWLAYEGVEEKSGRPCGIGLINDSCYSFSAAHQSFAMTVVRSPLYAHHEPEPLPCADRQHYMDLGEHTFQYILLPYQGKLEDSGIVKCAQELNAPPQILLETWHEGTLPVTRSYFALDGESAAVIAFKKAESGAGYIMRMQELYGNAVTVGLTSEVFGISFSITFRPNEMKSIRIYRRKQDGEWAFEETDFMESETVD